MRLLLIVLMLSLKMCSPSQEQQTQVMICSALHGLHKNNTNYPYDTLFSRVENFKPEIVGVEIRQEDIDSSVAYLKNFYPFEMYEIANRNRSKTVYGFDWLGSSIEGKPIPSNYFKELDILKIQKQASLDSVFQQSLTELDKLAGMKREIAGSSTISALNDRRYDSLNEIYYKKMDSLYAKTPYEKLAAFYKKRDTFISNRIIDIIATHKGKRMVFVLGADHRSNAIKTFQEKFGNDPSVTLVTIK